MRQGWDFHQTFCTMEEIVKYCLIIVIPLFDLGLKPTRRRRGQYKIGQICHRWIVLKKVGVGSQKTKQPCQKYFDTIACFTMDDIKCVVFCYKTK